ncbi:MAG: hypothetical protein LIO79_09025 [Rikenellaceae bacterium]|nr:hypothetical protein [Rikenellaceae bacterium]
MNKIIKSFLAAGAAVLTFASASAQGHEDLLRFSQYNYSLGTARSAAMGGAFSSLGADFSSMVINPAGLGMYRRSEISITPNLTVNKAKTTNVDELGNFGANANKTKFGLNNFGGVFNVYNGTRAVTSFSFGFGYSKLADFNSNTSVIGRSRTSMIDYFGEKIANSGIIPSPDSPLRYTGSNQGLWDAILAYNTFLLDYDFDDNTYFTKDLFDPDNAVFSSRLTSTTSGSIGQYDISAGMNFLNVLYMGFGFGIQDISYHETLSYQETPENNSGYGLNHFRYVQNLKQDGTAWNFKFGVIVRPIEQLRFSLAVHTPTYIAMDEYYYADMYSYFNDYNNGQAVYDGVETGNRISYNIQTPTRFLAGISYMINSQTLGPLGVISLDYERVWYNKMKFFDSGWNNEDYYISRDVEAIYKPANNIRVGAEAILTPNVFLRLGYAYYDSVYEHSEDQDYGKSSNYSLGLGYRTGGWSFDVAYIYMDRKEIPRQFYNGGYYQSGIYKTTNNRNNFTLTASVRF